jgi:hypothetical protein
MMWIFEWDIVTGDSAALDSIYAVSRDQLDAAIAEGQHAAEVADDMRSLVSGTDPGRWHDAGLRKSFVDAVEYEANLLRTLAAYRTTVLRHVQWLDTGTDASYEQWRTAEQSYRAARDEHVARYGGDVDLPAYNFTAADLGAQRADRDLAMAWLARGLLALIVVAATLGAIRRRGPGATALRALFVAATRPWRLAQLEAPTGRFDRVLVWLLPLTVLVLSRSAYTWFAAPAHLAATLGGWLLFAGVLRWLVRGRDPFHLWAAISGVVLLRTAILLVALVQRGPGRYWFNFWTAPGPRTLYITVAFAAFGWLFVVVAIVLRQRYGLLRREAVGRTMVAGGLTLALLAGGIAVIGLEKALTVWNDQLALLPWGLSRILGITVYLGIPASLPAALSGVGLVIAVAGALAAVRYRHGATTQPGHAGGQ